MLEIMSLRLSITVLKFKLLAILYVELLELLKKLSSLHNILR